MAHILIVSELDPTFVIKVEQTDDGEVFGDCGRCGDSISDRNHFEDTVESIVKHVDRNNCQVMIA